LDEVWKSHIEVSKDHGKTWTHIPIRHEDTVEVIQPSILEHADGVLQILCRSKQNYVMTTFSKDEGKTWQNWQTTNLKNPNAATDAIKIHNGLFMIVYNPDIAGKEWWQGRTKLYIAISKDGIRWKDVIQLENGEEGDEYSYPTIIQDSKNNIHITYTWNRKTIRHVVLK
jgi:alpha-L-fucosidase